MESAEGMSKETSDSDLVMLDVMKKTFFG